MSLEENAQYLRRPRSRQFVGAFDEEALDGADALVIMKRAFPSKEFAESDETFYPEKSYIEGASKLTCLYEERSDGDYELRGVFNAELINKQHLQDAVEEINNSYPTEAWVLVDVTVDYENSDISVCCDILDRTAINQPKAA